MFKIGDRVVVLKDRYSPERMRHRRGTLPNLKAFTGMVHGFLFGTALWAIYISLVLICGELYVRGGL